MAAWTMGIFYQAHLLLRRTIRHSAGVLLACNGRILQRQHDLGGAPLLGTRRHVLGATNATRSPRGDRKFTKEQQGSCAQHSTPGGQPHIASIFGITMHATRGPRIECTDPASNTRAANNGRRAHLRHWSGWISLWPVLSGALCEMGHGTHEMLVRGNRIGIGRQEDGTGRE